MTAIDIWMGILATVIVLAVVALVVVFAIDTIKGWRGEKHE